MYHSPILSPQARLIDERVQLLNNGFAPTPCYGKRALLNGWASIHGPTVRQIEEWSKERPNWSNTGLLTRLSPAFDIDVLDEHAAQALEDLTRLRFGGLGRILVRTGLPPKRAIPFQCDDPFKKIVVPFVEGGKLEFLGDGQQFVAFGIHPDTHRPYEWDDGLSPLTVERSELPHISEAEARELVQAAVKLLVDHFGYRLLPTPEPARFTPLAAPVNGSRYGATALDRACTAIGGASNGEQEATLNRQAFSIGALVGGGAMDRATALNRITDAALSMPSYDSRRPWRPLEVVEKVNRAFAQGQQKPRQPRRMAS